MDDYQTADLAVRLADLKTLCEIYEVVLLQVVSDEQLRQSNDPRTRQALRQLEESAHSLYVACLNLGLIEAESK